ncbi:uncharacterized protein [Ptychodera flava]|uniref:uncharacterized protein n=1 Tax=Ptychodera flava TaxID=63121 RepID=UPI00396A28FD
MEHSWENKATLTVVLLDEPDWPPFYNSTCETPVYEGPSRAPNGYNLADVFFGEDRMRAPFLNFPGLILEADTGNGQCGMDIFLDLFDTFRSLCDCIITFSQQEGPPVRSKTEFYIGKDTFPSKFSHDSSIRSDCMGKLSIEQFSTTGGPIMMLLSAVFDVRDVFINTLKIEIVSQGCPEGRYGFLCDKDCICRNGASCHGFNGACKCQKGWTGPACDIASKEIWIVPMSAVPIYDQMFSLSCHYSFKVKPTNSTIWTFFNGSSSRIPLDPIEQVFYELQSSRLTIAHFNKDRVGTYQCTVADQGGTEYVAETTITFAGNHVYHCNRYPYLIVNMITNSSFGHSILYVQAPNITDCPGDLTVGQTLMAIPP